MEVLKRIGEWLSNRRKPAWQPLVLDATGFSVGPHHLDWAAIQSVAALKRDLVTADDVWFQLEGPGEPLMVCEEQPGFAAWEAALVTRFPSVSGWRKQVVQPPFAQSFTLLYRRT